MRKNFLDADYFISPLNIDIRTKEQKANRHQPSAINPSTHKRINASSTHNAFSVQCLLVAAGIGIVLGEGGGEVVGT